MKPSDFFLSRRQFLGLLVPGALWLAIGLWICGRDPFDSFEHTPASRLALFISASYVVGYFMQTASFALLYRLKKARAKSSPPNRLGAAQEVIAKLRSQVREAIQSKPHLTQLDQLHLDQFCKWYAAKKSPFFQSEFDEFEDEINFTVSMSFPMLVLGVVGEWKLLVSHSIMECKWCHWGGFLLIFLMGCYMLLRFRYLWRAEEEAWYRAFLLTWWESQEKSLGTAEHRKPETGKHGDRQDGP